MACLVRQLFAHRPLSTPLSTICRPQVVFPPRYLPVNSRALSFTRSNRTESPESVPEQGATPQDNTVPERTSLWTSEASKPLGQESTRLRWQTDASSVAPDAKLDSLYGFISDTFTRVANRAPLPDDPHKLWAERSQRRLAQLPKTGTAHSGRSMQVVNGDVGVAYKRLMAVVSRNRVKAELQANARYEKPTARRWRLRSTRHRRRFAELIKKKVQLVQAIRRRGG